MGPTSSALTTTVRTFACGERFHFNPLGECLAEDALSEVYFQLLESRISFVLWAHCPSPRSLAYSDLACYTPALAKPELMILQPRLCSLGSPVYLGRAASNLSL